MATTVERQKQLARRWYLANRERTMKATLKWRKANPEKVAAQRRRYRLKKYGLSPQDYQQLLQAQKRCCAICRVSPDRLYVDHCHRTGRVRGLLCNTCNRALGLFRDSVKLLSAARAYLEN